MMKCADDVYRALPMYAERGAFFDSAVSARRNERSRVDRA
jgi:hypothetical protein